MYLRGCCSDCETKSLGLAGIGDYDPSSEPGFIGPPLSDAGPDGVTGEITSMIGQFSGAIPMVGPFVQGAMQFASTIDHLISQIGKGRKEADIIVNDPQSGQNALMAGLGTITDAIRTGKYPTVAQLQEMLVAVYAYGEAFKRFVLSSKFVDRRASGQALNTVMPYIDGTCGYAVPLGRTATPGIRNCGLSWGDGTVGGVGTNGMMGAITRAIYAAGGQLPSTQVMQNAATGIPTLGYPGVTTIPQSGTLPYPGTPQYAPGGIIQIGGGGGLSPSLMLCLGALFLLKAL